MREYWMLTKLQLLSLFGFNKIRHSRSYEEKKQLRKSLWGFIAMVVGLGYFSTFYSIALIQALLPMRQMEMLISLMALATSVLILFFSIREASSILFRFNDYDLVMSWPVRVESVTASRVTMMYVYNLVYALLLMLPAGVLYGVYTGQGARYYALYILLTPFVPIVPTLLGAILGTIVTMFTSRMKRSGALTAALQILLALGIMALSMYLNTGMTALADNVTMLGGFATKGYPPVMWFTSAVVGKAHGGLYALLLVVTAVVLMLLFCRGVGRVFVSLHTRMVSVPVKRSVRRLDGGMHRHSGVRALYCVEWKRYIGSPLYLSNTAFGYVMMLILAVVIGVIRPKAVMAFLQSGEFSQIRTLLPLIVGWMAMMSTTTASAVSMEGNRLWIVKSLPVRGIDWLMSKMLVSLTPAVPSLIICAVLLALGLKCDAFETAWLFILPLSCSVFAGTLGLWLNLKLPKLDWKSEVEVIKQSMSVMVQVFASMLLLAIPAVLLVITGWNWILPAFCAISLLVTALVWVHFTRVADEKLYRL